MWNTAEATEDGSVHDRLKISLCAAEGELIASSVVSIVQIKTHVHITVDIRIGPKLVSFIKDLVCVVRGSQLLINTENKRNILLLSRIQKMSHYSRK